MCQSQLNPIVCECVCWSVCVQGVCVKGVCVQCICKGICGRVSINIKLHKGKLLVSNSRSRLESNYATSEQEKQLFLECGGLVSVCVYMYV